MLKDVIKDQKMSDFAHKIVILLSRNNINLQTGMFQTQEELDARRNELAKHEF